MYLHITLKSGRTMHGGMTQSTIEVVEASYGVRSGRYDGEQPAISWRTPHWKPSHHSEIEGFLFLDESDVAILASNDGKVLHEWRGAKRHELERESK
ncbi:hypothetical protein [Klebsiella oxytoca]|uniref:Uncharacterized protein n=1 Tax=Klebsiella oxytoca TaxID=571 RepID=A0AAD3UR35_KLEOX|nr:hypothetical protein [Klebsiella oxytoca]ELT9979680.1 hypothetical protein [Klebsiella oxytoca]MBL6084011.1 hypothetical protein [Klebsiella oxytoca]MBL6248390.1 hypothetical protein [Klebsiella oxytoca]MBL6271008.1 hypothetical protein [Klebsiella oxytoca]